MNPPEADKRPLDPGVRGASGASGGEPKRPSTTYERIVERAKNNKAIAIGIVCVTVIGTLAPIVKNAVETARVISRPAPSLDKLAEGLGSSQPESRLQAVQGLVQASGQSKERTQQALLLLTAYIKRRMPAPPDGNASQVVVSEVEPAIKVLSALALAAEREWGIHYSADLSKLDLRRANLKQAYLRGANFSYTRLEEAVLDEADLGGAIFLGSRLDRVSAMKATLAGARVSATCLEEADLSGANLSKTTIIGSDLNSSRLNDANLSGASITETKMANISLVNATLDQASFERVSGLMRAAVGKARDTQKLRWDPSTELKWTAAVCN